MSGLLASLVLIGVFLGFMAILLFLCGLGIYWMHRAGNR
jgi:hypothetical protein